MEIKVFKTADLNPAPYNPRVHPEKAISRLSKSIATFGFTNPILVQKGTNTVIAGHARIKACEKAGVVEVPVIELDFDDVTAKAYNIADNRLAELTEWDYPALKDLITEIDTGALDIELTGFDEVELKGIIDYDPYPATDQDDAVPEVAEEPVTKTGDLYQLGRHRLLCGDSTKREDVERLMDGKKADMVFTDPPYGVDYSGRGQNTKVKIENDNLNIEDFRPFLLAIFKNTYEFSSTNASAYVWHADSKEKIKSTFEDTFAEAGWHYSATIIWVKKVASMGWQDYRSQHEPMLYGFKEGHNFYGDRAQTTVWHQGRDSNYVHPTQKPVELGEKAMQNSSQRGGVVLDLFGGSGSTLIAAEKTQRVANVCEIDPHYCDVIVKRWEEFTGQKAARL